MPNGCFPSLSREHLDRWTKHPGITILVLDPGWGYQQHPPPTTSQHHYYNSHWHISVEVHPPLFLGFTARLVLPEDAGLGEHGLQRLMCAAHVDQVHWFQGVSDGVSTCCSATHLGNVSCYPITQSKLLFQRAARSQGGLSYMWSLWTSLVNGF